MGIAYKSVEQFLDKIDTGVWVEIGVERGEGSTRWFAEQAAGRATKLYAVDAMKEQCEQLSGLLQAEEKFKNVQIVNALGETFLKKYRDLEPEARISLAYLDNFDWDYWLGIEEEPFVPEVKARYRQNLKVEMNNLNSQLSHLMQAMYLVDYLTENCLVICDDTWYHPNEGVFIGKCSAAIPYLATQGLSVIHAQGYRQNSTVIMGKFTDKE